MAGGLLNLVAVGNQNCIINGNPTKTFFKCVYRKYTNFGLQKFRIDMDGQRILQMNTPSTFNFKIPRYGDILLDTYLVVALPNIWSPIAPPPSTDLSANWCPYEYKWIDDIGTQMIAKITLSTGGQIIQECTGEYLTSMVKRDFSNTKKDMFNKMTGNINEYINPAENNIDKYGNKRYPSALYWNTTNNSGEYYIEPSIKGRNVYVPINFWFTLLSQMGFPLIALQYNELTISIVMRPVNELFTIRDPLQPSLNYPVVQPNFTQLEHQFWHFVHPPPDISLNTTAYPGYPNIKTDWDADLHLLSTYAFLSDDEAKVFAAKEQRYLIKEIHEYNFQNITGSSRVQLDTHGLVANWMFYFKRSDINLRNQWSNYSNWAYNGVLPYDLSNSPHTIPSEAWTMGSGTNFGPGQHKNYTTGLVDGSSNIYITGDYHVENVKNILTNMAILLDGKYRENLLPYGVFDYVEKYSHTPGNAPDGLYCYNFCLDTNQYTCQPSGAINMSKFNKIELEFNTFIPPLDISAATYAVCSADGGLIGINKSSWRTYLYDYDLTVLEERFNILSFKSGICGLEYTR